MIKILINYLLISEKFYDKDITDIPDYSKYIKNSIYDIDVIDIRENEIDCLKILQYKLDHHSIYDIMRGFMYNGFIFEKEIDINSIQIKFAYNYAEKIFRDIVYSYIAIIHPPYLIAFVIIHLTRKKFFDSKYMKKIKKIYGIKQNDYKECYDDIKSFLNNVEKGLKVCDYNNINKKIKKEKEDTKIKENEKEDTQKSEDKNDEKQNQIDDIKNNISTINLESDNSQNNEKTDKKELSSINKENKHK